MTVLYIVGLIVFVWVVRHFFIRFDRGYAYHCLRYLSTEELRMRDEIVESIRVTEYRRWVNPWKFARALRYLEDRRYIDKTPPRLVNGKKNYAEIRYRRQHEGQIPIGATD